jgi:glucans biosynthesis protein
VFSHSRLQMVAVLAVLLVASAAGGPAPNPPRPPPREAFSFATVERLAQDRAARTYHERSPKLPQGLAKLGYDQYRDIRFRRAGSLWFQRALFEVQFFHRGFTFDRRVNIFEVSAAGPRAVAYSPAMFEFGKLVPPMKLPADLGFAGFRVHYPLNSPAYKDEVIVFLGASYFRVLGRGQRYGLSARGLAVNTATTGGEEFPYFTDFWLVRPEPQQRTLTLYALLDSPSVTGAYRFELRPGAITQVEVSGELYPRRTIEKVGIGALTSMFLRAENSGARHFDDFRPEVHDSDGLMAQTGVGEWTWRPLVDPRSLRVNRFMDEHPRGFGLIQRDRDFSHYQDTEAHFDLRPSYWIEPLGDWGKGGVELVEIPTEEEIHDNIVAYWVPSAAAQPHKPFSFSYLLSAFAQSSQWPPGGRSVATRIGSATIAGTPPAPAGQRRLVLDFAGGDLDGLDGTQPVQAQVTANGGQVDAVTVERVPEAAVWRVAFRLKPNGEKPMDLRCYLTLYGEALTETWTYLWSPGGGA